MQKILIRYLAGSRMNQVDEFPATAQGELIIGRDAAADVRFDADLDDLVSRQHSKIIQNPWSAAGFQLVDLQSRNGTFLNHQRVYGTVALNHNDVVQLGAGGPEFRFEIDPPPVVASDAGMASGMGMKATRESRMEEPQGGPRQVGRATVERMLGDVFTRVKKQTRRSRWVTAAALFVLLAGGAGGWYYMRVSQRQMQQNLSQAQAQNQAELDRVNEELKKGPEAVAQATREVQRLEAELRASNNRNESSVRALELALEAQKKQAAALAKALQQQQKNASQNPSTAPAPAAPVTVRGTAPDNAKPSAPTQGALGSSASFDVLANQVRQLIDQGRAVEALGEATQLIQMDGNRWEGYALAGETAQKLSDYKLAGDMYQRALMKAPPDARADLESKLSFVQERAK